MRSFATLLVFAALFCGCAPRYHVVTTGYLDPGVPAFAPGPAFAVLPNEPASNPIFDRELASKIERVLIFQGYRSAPPESADYVIRYQYGVEGRQVTTERPVTHFGPRYVVTSASGTRSYVQGYDYVTYVPELHMLYVSRLGLTVAPARPAAGAAEPQPVWIGETFSESSQFDLRKTIDYLLASSFRFFGVNTPEHRETTLKPDDPIVRHLQEQPAPAGVPQGATNGSQAT